MRSGYKSHWPLDIALDLQSTSTRSSLVLMHCNIFHIAVHRMTKPRAFPANFEFVMGWIGIFQVASMLIRLSLLTTPEHVILAMVPPPLTRPPWVWVNSPKCLNCR